MTNRYFGTNEVLKWDKKSQKKIQRLTVSKLRNTRMDQTNFGFGDFIKI